MRAIANVGGYESVLLLRLKALAGDGDAEVVGQCFSALMGLDPRESVAFVERFLTSKEPDVVIEAVGALAASREPQAFEAVRRLWLSNVSTDVRRATVFSCAASPLPVATEFLLAIVAERGGNLAVWALSALADSRFRSDVSERARLAAERSDDSQLIEAYRAAFESR